LSPLRIVAEDGQRIDERDVIRSMKGEIATFKVPKRVHIVAELAQRDGQGRRTCCERFS
jgi:hypothetical protein